MSPHREYVQKSSLSPAESSQSSSAHSQCHSGVGTKPVSFLTLLFTQPGKPLDISISDVFSCFPSDVYVVPRFYGILDFSSPLCAFSIFFLLSGLSIKLLHRNSCVVGFYLLVPRPCNQSPTRYGEFPYIFMCLLLLLFYHKIQNEHYVIIGIVF